MEKSKASQLENTYIAYREGRIELIEFLKALPGDSEPEFQLYLTRLVEESSIAHRELLDILQSVTETNPSLAYAAFVGLATYYRRVQDLAQLANLLATYHAHFEQNPLFSLFESLYLLAQGSPESLRAALASVRLALKRAPGHPGVKAAFADIVATGYEIGAFKDTKLLDEAVEQIGLAIRKLPSYAKYYALLGKIHYCKGDFKQAIDLVSRAIDLEDPGRHTYALRIGYYQQLLSHINYTRADQELADRIAHAEAIFKEDHARLLRMIEEAKGESLTQLAFFSGIIAIIFSAVQITGTQAPTAAATLILILSGSLLVVFGCFAFSMLTMRFARVLPILVVGVLLVLVGVYLITKVPSQLPTVPSP